jgi:hypothetical protein
MSQHISLPCNLSLLTMRQHTAQGSQTRAAGSWWLPLRPVLLRFAVVVIFGIAILSVRAVHIISSSMYFLGAVDGVSCPFALATLTKQGAGSILRELDELRALGYVLVIAVESVRESLVIFPFHMCHFQASHRVHDLPMVQCLLSYCPTSRTQQWLSNAMQGLFPD